MCCIYCNTPTSLCKGGFIIRLPNGYGSVYKLPNSNHRRKPYCVRKSYFNDGKRQVEYLGYFATRTEAMNFLAQYNLSPKEKANSITFNDIYTMWSEWHYPTLKENSVKVYENAYKKCYTIYKYNFIDITQDTLQALVDNEKGISSKQVLFSMFKSIWDYGVKKDIIPPDKNRVRYLDIPKVEKSTKHKRLTNEELALLWKYRDDENIALFLILIYTGCRPMELFSLTPNQVYENYFEILDGKTENAKRLVPIHMEIKPLFDKYMRYDIVTQSDYCNWVNNRFKPIIRQLEMDCTPYDARHTFATLWAESKLDDYMRCKIQGHSVQSIGQRVYTHYDINILCEEMNKLQIVKHTSDTQ